MKKLYKFCWEVRGGKVEGLFIATEKEVKEAIGEEVYFGEILGKHSEVYGEIEEGEITEVEVSQTTLKELEEILGTNISGYNPLKYIQYQCALCEYTMSAEDSFINDEGEIVCQDCIEED